MRRSLLVAKDPPHSGDAVHPFGGYQRFGPIVRSFRPWPDRYPGRSTTRRCSTMRIRSTLTTLALAGLALTACGTPPSAETGSEAGGDDRTEASGPIKVVVIPPA